MENKSNSLSRIKRQQREKVLRFSIRKYSFGAASVAVAALMFLGARVASADSLVDKTSQLNAGVVNPKNEAELPQESPDTTEKKVDAENQALTTAAPSASTVDKAKLKKVVEELNGLLSTKLNLAESVVSPVKDRLQKGKEALESSELAQKDIDELVELLSKDVTVVSAAKEATEVQVDKQADKTEKPADNLASQISPEVSASEENQTVSAKKDSLKVSVDQLQAAVLELPEHETSKEVLEKANELLGLAQGVLENTTVSLNDVEDMTKRVKRMFNSVKNATTRLTSGARDSRNGQSMGQGTQFRAYTATSSSGAMKNVRYFASVDPKTNNGKNTRNDDPEFTEKKTVIKSRYEQNSSGRWMVYDVYFNNNGISMVDQSYGQHYYFQPPFNIMDPSNTVRDLTITRYKNVNQDPNKKLSDGGSGFQQVGNTVTISNPWVQKDRIFDGDRRSLYDPNSGVTRANQKWYVFKNNQNDGYLDSIVRKTDGNYTGGVSYTLGMEVGKSDTPYAIHMTARVKLKDNVTDQQAANGNVYAASVTSGGTTNQSYIVGSRGTSVKAEPAAPKDPIKGQTVTKTVGDPLGNPDDPANSGYVRHKENKPFPAGMNWSWQGNVKPTSTAKAGVFKYKVIARYQDGTSSEDKGSGSDGTVTLNVKPKQPTITTNVANKKGLPNQQITVNVGSGVPDGSTVNIYDGDTVIGTGTTKGETATVTVKGALPGKPITAKTVVTNNNGTVTSDKSKPVTPTEVPDNQKPQATLNGITLTETANTPIFTVYRGAEFNPELKVWDNSGKISKVTVGNLPSGVSASNFTAQTGKDGSSEDKKYKTRLSSGIVDTQTLGEYTATLHVEGSSATDSRDLKFKYRVVDIESKNLENGVAKVPVGSTLNVPNSRTNVDAHNYLKVVDSKDKADRGNSHLPQGMTWTWKSGDKLDPGTTLDNSGKYTRNATAQFPSSVTDNNSTTRTTFAPTEIKRPVVLAVTPTAPSVVANENGSVTVTPPTRPNGTTPQDIDTITLTYTPTGKTTPETVTVAKSGNNWTVNGKTTDKVSVTPAGVVTISDLEVADGKEVTAKVSKRIDNNVVLESPVAKVTSKSSKPAKPVAVAKDNGDVTGKPQDPAKADKITVSYTGEDNQPKTAVGKKDPKGKWTVNTPEVQINPNTGEITIPENKVKDGTEVTVVTKNGDGADSDPAKATAKFSKPAKPVATAKDNGDVTGKPQNPAKADKITVSYTGEDNQPKTAVGTKDPKGNWTVNTPEVQINPKTGEITIPDNKVKDGTEVTVVTKNGNSTDSDLAKAVAKDAIKPEATLNGVRLTENANSPIFTVYRGATFNPELKVWDNSGVISKVEVKGGLPKGVTASTFTSQTGKTEANPYATRLSSGTVLNTETLGEHEATLHVEGSSATDSRDLKFKYRVVDIETRNLENGIAKVPVASTLNVAKSGKNIDAHRYLKVVDSEDKADRGNNYLPSGMTWTWKAGDKLDPGTTLDNSGKYTRNATAVFPDTSKNSITDVNSTTRTTFAPAEIKRQVVLAVTPTVPSVVGHENGSVTITPPTRPNSTNPQDIDTITLTYVPTGKTTPETVTVTKSGNTWTVNGKTADKVSVTPAGVVTISDAEVADKTEITAKVSKRIDNVVLESPVARGTANGSLGAEVTPPAPVLEKEKTTPVTVVTPNKPGSTITTETPVNGLTVDGDGNLTGTPTVTDWGPKEEERKVTIPVKVKHGDEVVPVNVPVTIQRDTDGDGIPDKVDTDDDNDGIPDKDDANPKVADKLTGDTTGKTVKEKTPVPANTKVVTPNKPGTTITVDGPVNGLTVDNGGNLVGTPSVTDWGPKEEERTVEIPVKLKRGTEETVVKVPVNIERDTDGDGIPDKVDPDDDNDGIPDKDDANPKVADGLTGDTTGKTVKEKTPVPANTKVVTPNKPGTTISVDGPVNGLTVDNGGNLVETPTVDNWEPKEEERTVEIPVKLKRGTEETVVKIPVTIQRDTDGDGIPDVTDPDDDNDGIPDKDDANPKVADKLTGTVTDPGKVKEKAPVPPTKVVTPNKPGSTITTETPVNGLTVDGDGNLTGTPTVEDWGPKEEERKVTIPVKVKNGDEEITVDVPVTIQRDTDGDGIPDVTDPDDDNDGIPDTEDATPKVADKLTGTVTDPGKVKEKASVPPTKVVTPNKPGSTITTETPVNGLTVDGDGNLTGTPTVEDWGPKEEERKVTIPVKVKNGDEEITVDVPVTIQRDTDGDGIPDVTDPDDDNDGIPDKDDANPKVADKLTGTVTDPGKVKEKAPVPPTKVVTPNKPGSTITTETPVNGLTVDGDGNLTGTPTVEDWGPKEEERKVTIPVKVKNGDEEITVDVPVTIQRDTDGDGIPDVTDPDDDNDGIPDTEDATPKVADKLTGTVTDPGKVKEKASVPPTKVVTPNKPGSTITTETPVNGLTVDGDGNLTGTPTVTDWGPKEEERKVTIPVKVKNGDEEVVVDVPVTIQRDTDGDGIPDVTDPDDDNDGIPDKDEEKNGTDPKTPTTQTPTIEIARKPNGDAVITPKKPDGSTYQPGTVVEIPGKDGNPIVVTIGEDGSGIVPNDKLPKGDLPGKGTVTEPNKEPSQPVDVTTPARKNPTIKIEQDPKTGDVTVTPKKPDGSIYPPGTVVEIPGKDGNPITVTIGEDGKGTVPNSDLPEGDIPGTGKIIEKGKTPEEVQVKTPKKLDPNEPQTEQPVSIDITRKPNGDAIVTPKKPGVGGTYPPGTKVVIPGDNDTPIEVIIGEDGSGIVPNDSLPKGKIEGEGTVTEPNKRPSQPVPATTPARKTPTVDLEQDPKTGDVTVTPKKPDGSIYPPGTVVEIPGKGDKPITVTIGEDGKGKVPNSELPDGKVTKPGKITEPGKPSVEVPEVTTPAKVTPTVDLEQDPKTGDVTVTPKKPDGSIYPPGTVVEIPGKGDKPITVTIGEDGKGKVPNSELPDGKVTKPGKITEPGKPSVEVPNVTTPAKVTPTVDLEQDPKTGDVTVTPKRPDGSTFPPGTVVEIPGKGDKPITVTIGEDGKGKVPNSELPDGKVTKPGKITEPGKPSVEVPNVTTPAKVTPTVDLEQDPKTGDVTVTPKRPDGSTFPPGTVVEIPGKGDKPITVTIGEDGKGKVPNSELPDGKVTKPGKITEPGKPSVEVPNVTTPAKVTPTVDLEQDPKTGDVTVTPKRPDGSTYPPGTVVEIPGKGDKPITVTIGEDGKGKVPNSELPDGKVTKPGKITEPGKPSVEVPNVTTPAKVTPTVDLEQDPKTGDVTVTPKRPDGSTFPPGTVVEIPGKGDKPITVIIGEDGKGKVPNSELPDGKVTKPGKIIEPGKPAVEVPNVTTPAKVTPTVDLEQDPKTGDVTVTPKRPDGSTFPPGTVVEIPGKGDKPITVTIGEDGKGKVPNSELPDGKVTKPGKITEPGKPSVEVPNVTTPAKVTPTVDLEQDPKTGDVTVTPKRPDGSTFPPGTVVEIPGKGDKPITVTIGEDGKGKVPNSELPDGKVTKPGKITEPGKPSVEVPNVTTPAKVTPTVDLEQDPKTGDVTVTPKRPDGSTYPPGTVVEIPGKGDKPITVTIGEDGKGKVPNSELPDGKVTKPGKITEPGKPAVEVPNVTTPAKFTPETSVTEKPGKIEITQQPNGNAIVTPKKPDGTTYPSGSKVEIPGENGTTITVTIGDNGSGEVPNDKLPKGDLPGKGTVTEPNKKPSQPVDVTTPARKTPTIELDQDPKTGDVTVTPKKPDGSTYPPGTTVEIPGKDGNPIIVTIDKEGKGKVPNSELPDGKVPGTGKITEPGKAAVEVPVETPAKVTPATPDTPVKPDTNGDSGQDTPAPATPTPNAVTPNADQVDTKITVDNGAKSNDSQNVLPNTGTESNAALASLGLLGLLSGFGLVARKKKED